MTRSGTLVIPSAAALLAALLVSLSPVAANAGARGIASPVHRPSKGIMCPTVCENVGGQTVCWTDCR